MSKRVFITGFGIVSSIGCNEDEVFQSLCSCKSGINDLKFLNTKLSNAKVAEVKKSNDELIEMASLPYSNLYSRTFL